MKLTIQALAVACALIAARAEDSAILPGHSMHGEAFNEGPRQAAVLLNGTGDVHFAITSSSADAQRFFDQGIGQLHGFWYFEAERSFRQVAALDPGCGLAYWGMAMANVNNPKRAADFMKQAMKRRDKASHREQLWLDAYSGFFAESKKDEKQRREALVSALEKLGAECPDDIEAKAFRVLQLWDNKGHGVPYPNRKAVDALAKEVLAVNPNHPGIHHYRIHLWNSGDGDKNALDSAALCGQSAPGIAHLWHMSGHTYSALKRYADAAWQQEASARVDHAQMIASRIMPDQIHNFAHNNDWLVQDLGYVGRVHDAIDLAKNMIELPRMPSSDSKSYTLGRARLLETLLKYELWDELIALDGTMYLSSNETPADDMSRLRALGVAYSVKGNRGKVDEILKRLDKALKDARRERIDAADKAEEKAQADKKSDDEISKQMADAMRRITPRINNIQGNIAELRMYRAIADGNISEARKQLTATRDISAERQARLWLQIGDKDKAEKLARDAISKDDKQVQPLANLAWVLWGIGKKKESFDIFKKLRELSAEVDLDAPAFVRLAPIAQEMELRPDWRVAFSVAGDVGQRPALESLGPFRWHPSPAPSWSLTDGRGLARTLSSYAGRPVLMIFYLGHGCAGCIEQLNAFGPMAKQFEDAGISIVAIGTDPADALHETFAKAKGSEGFPFPILADPALEVFKTYRAFDDFEQQPLHGTFFIDGTGLVRWQDIAFQPFRDAKWMLNECKRLLTIPPYPQPAQTTAGN